MSGTRSTARSIFFDWESTGIAPLQPDYNKSPFELAVTVAPLIFGSDERSVWKLANLVQLLDITASDPHLQPYLSPHDIRPGQSQHICRQWMVPMDHICRLDQVDKSCQRGNCCIAPLEKTCACKAPRGWTRASDHRLWATKSPSTGLTHFLVSETTAEGWYSHLSAKRERRRYVVPISTEIGDVVIDFRYGPVHSALVVREAESADHGTMSIIGKARLLEPQSPLSQDMPHCEPEPPWLGAAVTMDATIEEMISFLVPYQPDFTFHPPRIVSFWTKDGMMMRSKLMKEYKVIDQSRSPKMSTTPDTNRHIFKSY